MGAKFRMVVVYEGLDNGNGTFIAPGALITNTLPLSLLAMLRNSDGGHGHGAAEVVGRIDSFVRESATSWVDGATGMTWGQVAGTEVFAWVAEGEFADRPEAVDAETLVRGKYLKGISVDIAEVVSEIEATEFDPETGEPVRLREVLTAGVIGAATVCSLPAFRGCSIELVDDSAEMVDAGDLAIAASGVQLPPWVVVNDCLPCRDEDTVVASGGPLAPPGEWFQDPEFDGPTPMTVQDDGRVYGHLALWDSCHTGMQGKCVTPPRSATRYSLFHLGAVRTAEGTDVPVGHLTYGGGHADLHKDAAAAMAHYDDAGTAVADVTAGEDAWGIWFAGALRPGVTEEQVRGLRASALSGDWRRHGSGLELMAALAVNVAGFPVPRAVAASGAPLALVAAGAGPVVAVRDRRVDDAVVEAAVARALAPIRRREALARLAAAGAGRS